MNKEEKEISESMINRYGVENRIQHFHEEIGEVMTAISHHRRGRIDDIEVLGELADLQVLLNQVIVLYDPDPYDRHFIEIYEGKLQHAKGLLKAFNRPVYAPLKAQDIPKWKADYHLVININGDKRR